MTEQRLHSMDAVRAFALLGGIIVHATMSFSPAFAALGWPITDVRPSRTLQVVFHVLHSFRMTLFFLIAGFFARFIIERVGVHAFWKNRLKRIATPFVIGWITLIPLVAATFIWAVIRKRGGLPGDGSAAAAMGSGVPLAHLWFLYYLLLIYAAFTVVRWIVRRINADAYLTKSADMWTRGIVRKHIAFLILPIPIALALHWTPEWIMWTGIPTPQVGLTPHPAAIVAFGTAFTFGWLLHRQQDLLQTLGTQWRNHLVVALLASTYSLSIIGVDADAVVTSHSQRLIYIACYALMSWSWVLAILGLGLRFLTRPNPAVRFLADSSYWIYLVHLPIVFALQIVAMNWKIHWAIKFSFIVMTTLAVLLLSYTYLVRRTRVGVWLNGKRY